MDYQPFRSQVAALKAQMTSLAESLALLPADQRALASAELEQLSAAIARLLAATGNESVQAGNSGEGADGAPRIGWEPGPDDGPVWTAERTTRLYAINTALSVALTQSQVANVVVNQALPALSATAGAVMLYTDNWTLRCANVPASGHFAPSIVITSDEASPLVQAARTGQPVWIETPQELASTYPGWVDASLSAAASLAVVPLIAQGRVLGVMTLAFEPARRFTIADRAFMLVLAQQCSSALERVELYDQVRQAAALEERNRLARDLHDSVSQALYAIVLSVNAGRSHLSKDTSRVARALDNIESLTAAAQADLRALLFDLRADSVSRSGLVNALVERTQFLRLRHGLTVRTEFCAEPALGTPCKEALYGIAREALHNAAKHARASQVDLKLAQSPEGLVLEVRDDGIGFDPAKPRQRHYGLQSMRERAVALGIELHVESVLGQGTRVIAIVPAVDGSNEGSDSSSCWERNGHSGGPVE